MGPEAKESADSLIMEKLSAQAESLGKALGADAVSYIGPMRYGADDMVRDVVESRRPTSKNLVLLLETEGGYIEVVERIVNTLRHHYSGTVDFVIPGHAMSAGTVLVMSGDAIYMDYYSILGPIDPQIERRDGSVVPALGYLAEYERFVKKSKASGLTDAELAFFIERFDPGELYRYKKERDLSVALLRDWLVRYKFKNWKRTTGRKKKVTAKMKRERAVYIARLLNNTERWHSHGRGISREVLERDVKVIVRDFGAQPALAQTIKDYYGLLSDYLRKRRFLAVSHCPGKFVHA